jgi:multidrug efflux pump subunit AcrB
MAARMKSSSTPGHAARLLTGWWQWFYEGFEIIHNWLVVKTVRHVRLTLLIFALLFAGCFPLFSRIGFQFFPLADEGRLTVSIETSSSASLALTDGIVRGIEQYLSKKPHVTGVDAVIGGYGSGTGVNRASVRVYLDDDPARMSTFDLANAIRPAMANLPDTKISYTTSGMRGGIRGKALQLVIAATTWTT